MDLHRGRVGNGSRGTPLGRFDREDRFGFEFSIRGSSGVRYSSSDRIPSLDFGETGEGLRRFAYLGERGEILCQSGVVTDAEKKLKFASLPPNRWIPNEQDVMAVAGGWSLDPTTLSPASAAPANGIVAKIGAR